MPLYELSDEVVQTIKSSLRSDYIDVSKAFGALPIGEELKSDIENAYKALAKPKESHDK